MPSRAACWHSAVLFRSTDAVADYLTETATPSRRILGIVGEPGAGKSTIAAAIAAQLGAALLPMDGYHLPQAELVALGRRERMGAPDTFDVPGFIETLRELRAGGTVNAAGFDREIEEAVADSVLIPASAATIIVEGNYLLLGDGGWERVAPLLDATFFVSVDRDIRLARLIARHERFGKSPADARAWALGPDERNAVLVGASAHAATHTIALG